MGNNLCSNYFYTLVPGEQAGSVAGEGEKPRQRRKKSGVGGRRETVEDEGARLAVRPLGQAEKPGSPHFPPARSSISEDRSAKRSSVDGFLSE